MPSPERGATAKLLGFATHALSGLAIVTLVFPFVSADARRRLTRRWSRRLLAALGVGLRTIGERRRGAMLVANHISWLDVIAIAAIAPASFVAKSELRHWPLAGTLVSRAGSIFIDRNRKRDILRVNAALRSRLAAGREVALFPEGTTTDGSSVAPFRNALLQAAVDRGAPVQPVAIVYLGDQGRATSATAYCGETSFLESLRSVVSARGIAVCLQFDPPIDTRGLCRRRAGALARTRIIALLDELRGQHEAAALAERTRVPALGIPRRLGTVEQLADVPQA